jgi:LPS sulfotransferase NodH
VDQVDRLQRLLESHDEHWSRLVAGRRRVLELTYEGLVADVPATTAQVLRALGVPDDEARAAVADVRPELRRQAGAQTEQWVHETLSWRRRHLERAEVTG